MARSFYSFYFSKYFFSFIIMPASSKFPNKIAKKRLSMMIFPKITKEMKYKAENHPEAHMQSYMT